MKLPCSALSFLIVIVVAFVLDFTTFPGRDTLPVEGDADSCWLEFQAQRGSAFGCNSSEAVLTASEQLLPILNRLVERPFFRFVRVNLEKECPYWAVSLLCSSEAAPCTVWSCGIDAVVSL